MNDFVKFCAKYRRLYGILILIPLLVAADPTPATLGWGLLLMLAGMVYRIWASGYIYKDNRLAVEGPYSIVRNPLYFGSFILGAGAVVAANAPVMLLIYLVTYPTVYISLIMTEEVRLGKLFGDEYSTYLKNVPRLFPNPLKYKKTDAAWSFQLTFIDHKEYVTAIAIAAIAVVLLIFMAGEPASAVSGTSAEVTTVLPTVRVAAIQHVSTFGNPAANRAGLAAQVRRAAGKGARIIVLPEAAIPGYMSDDIKTAWQVGQRPMTKGLNGVTPEPVAETVPGPSTDMFAPLAAELGVYLTIPIIEIDPPTGRYFNTLVLAGPDGKLLLHYRKLNPWPFAEKGWATPGDKGYAYTDTPYGRLGLLICYDINIEPRNLRAAGVDILLYPIAWVDKADSTWFDAGLPDIAGENNMHIIGANWSFASKPAWHGWGSSRIIGRDGKIITSAENNLGNEILYADLAVGE